MSVTAPAEVDVLTRVAAVVRERGAHPAIVDRGEALSYAALWRWALAVRSCLIEQGIEVGDRVALAVDKSAAYVAALLGVWMAGAAFVPAPPELPPRRQRRILDEVAPARVLCRDEVERLRGVAVADDGRYHRAAAAELAYILYTSGSSGAPKGVMVPHRGVPGLLRAQARAFGLGPSSRSLFLLSTAFDASISDIGAALVAGATLVIAAPEALREPAGILEVIARERVTHVDIPPALLAYLRPEALPACLEALVIGGEVCPPHVVRRIAAVVRVINVYGPTEATVCASLSPCDAQTWTAPLLGAPLPGVRFSVRSDDDDGARELLSPGDEGELYIGGAGLALGYLDRPELTAARFVDRGGERLYRTGDRVRIREGGALEFRGRVDRQRKIAGVRVELAEIEAELRAHPEVLEAAVVDARGGLVAALVVRDGEAPPAAAALREHLRGALPAAVVPRCFDVVPALPRGPTGKVDLSALARQLEAPRRPMEGADRDGAGGAEVGARGLIAALWREVLRVPLVRAGDRFVDLGGGSLCALEVVAAAAAHGLVLSAADLLDNHSVAELAAGRGDGDLRPAAALRSEVERRAAPLVRAAPRAGASASASAGAGLDPDATLLLTGATGFLGRHLLARLRRRHRGRILALVRGRDATRAQQRLEAALASVEVSVPEASGTACAPVEVIVGDLTAPRLGVEARAWSRLAAEVDAIVHSGAVVNLAAGFEALRPTNVDGTATVLELALAERPKLLHHISTLSVFVNARPQIAAPREDDDLRGAQALLGGYAQSKWAAEVLVREVAAARLPCAIHRLGLVTGDRRSGQGPAHDQLGLFLRGLVELGAAPPGCARLRLDLSPVDDVADALTQLVLLGAGAGGPTTTAAPRTFHLASETGATAAELVAALRRAGARVDEVSLKTWRALGRRLHERSPAAAVAYLALERGVGGAGQRLHAYDLFLATGVTFPSPATDALLGPRERASASETAALLDRYVAAALRSS
ncbi:MAG: amino acid adenylation domain-containing protein [Nannocystaceae bacterium]